MVIDKKEALLSQWEYHFKDWTSHRELLIRKTVLSFDSDSHQTFLLSPRPTSSMEVKKLIDVWFGAHSMSLPPWTSVELTFWSLVCSVNDRTLIFFVWALQNYSFLNRLPYPTASDPNGISFPASSFRLLMFSQRDAESFIEKSLKHFIGRFILSCPFFNCFLNCYKASCSCSMRLTPWTYCR